MYLIELRDDCFNTGGFLRISGVVSALAQHFVSIGRCANHLQAEREAWPHVYAAIVNGHLHPKSEDRLLPLSNDDCAQGVVVLGELIQWFKTTRRFKLKLAIRTGLRLRAMENKPFDLTTEVDGLADARVKELQINGADSQDVPVKVGTDKTAKRNKAPDQFVKALDLLLTKIEAAATAKGEEFSRKSLPGTDRNLFDIAKKELGFPIGNSVSTFQKYRKLSGLCSFKTHAVATDFYENLFRGE